MTAINLHFLVAGFASTLLIPLFTSMNRVWLGRIALSFLGLAFFIPGQSIYELFLTAMSFSAVCIFLAEDGAVWEFLPMIFLSQIAAILLTNSSDLLQLILSLELQALISYIFVALRSRNDEQGASSEAALKYFCLGAINTACMLFGLSLVYGQLGSVSYEVLSAIESGSIGALGAAIMVVGVLFKMGAAPFHIWLPDACCVSYRCAIVFILSVHKIAPLFSLLSILECVQLPNIKNLIYICAICSFCIGTLGALFQQNFQRFVAYTSIADTGLILLLTILQSNAALYYIIISGLHLVGIFALMPREEGLVQCNKDLHILGSNKRFLSLFVLIVLSMMGVPLSAGFALKYFAFYQMIAGKHFCFAALFVMSSMISVFYYARLIQYALKPKYQGESYEPIAPTISVLVICSVTFGWVLLVALSGPIF